MRRRPMFPVAIAAIILASCSSRADRVRAEEQLSVRQRLQNAIDVTRRLEPKAREGDKEQFLAQPQLPADRREGVKLRCPLKSDVSLYAKSRPWTNKYIGRYQTSRASLPEVATWPNATDADELRKLLTDSDPAMRCVAIEALSTLFIPEDAPRIAALLNDDTEGLPSLAWNTPLASWEPFRITQQEGPVVERMRSWQPRKVKDYARLALILMTDRQFDADSFAVWWKRNSEAKHCLWYWQQRLQREMDDAEAVKRMQWDPQMTAEEYHKANQQRQRQVAARKEAVRSAVLKELETLPAEVEAKVLLLAANKFAGGTDITAPQRVFWKGIGPLRLSRTRLLDLMDRKNLWKDVDWKKGDGKEYYNRMVERLALSANEIFKRDDVERLRAVRDREKDNLWWTGQAALSIGISRLLPPADDDLDDPDTRDGTLRAAIRDSRDVVVRGYVARELVRVGLPRNWKFLKEQFFAEKQYSAIPDLRLSIIRELGATPLTKEKRAALRELVLDKRFKQLWTMSNQKGMGRDMYRVYSARSINAHIGEEAITYRLVKDLNVPENAEQRLPELLKIIEEELTP